MKPYVGVVGLKTKEEIVSAATAFYTAGFCTISDTPVSHDPVLIFDYNAESISDEFHLKEFTDSIAFAKTMIKAMKFGIRYRLPRAYNFPDEGVVAGLFEVLPGIDFFEFSHMYPSRKFISNLQERCSGVDMVSHIGASNILKEMLSKYLDSTSYSHYVFDTAEHGFRGLTSYAKKTLAKDSHSVGFAAKLDETDSLHIADLVEEVGKPISLEARCLVDRNQDPLTTSLSLVNQFIEESARCIVD